MKIACLLLTLATALMAEPETALKASRVDHVLVLNEVFLNGAGPFRMMIDTGNASSLICPKVAQRLNAHAKYAVEHVTASGTQLLPVVVLNEVRTGAVSDQAVEAMVGDVSLDGIDGVLGQSWLVRHDYLLDYRNRRLIIDGESPRHGARTGLRSTDGRPIVVAEVDGRHAEMVLDSGAAFVVLFETDGRPRIGAIIRTNASSTRAEEGSARIALADNPARLMHAIRVSSSEPAPGLLPASAFAAVFVSNRHGFVEFTR